VGGKGCGTAIYLLKEAMFIFLKPKTRLLQKYPWGDGGLRYIKLKEVVFINKT
jgi:hypothetical protein